MNVLPAVVDGPIVMLISCVNVLVRRQRFVVLRVWSVLRLVVARGLVRRFLGAGGCPMMLARLWVVNLKLLVSTGMLGAV